MSHNVRRDVVRRGLLALVVVPALAVAVMGQQKPTFRAGVEVVVLDVNVVDRSHVPVDDFNAGDFTVSVDGKSRKVVSAQFVRYDVRTTTTTGRERVTVPGQAAAPERAGFRAPARNVLIAVDTDSMEPGDGQRVRQEAGKFVDNLAPDDRIGVVTIPRMAAEITMTKDRPEVKAALAKVVTGSERYKSVQFSITMSEAFGIESGEPGLADRVIQRECGSNPPLGCPDQVLMEVREVQIQNHLRGQRLVDGLVALSDALKTVPGPKTLLFITGGSPDPEFKPTGSYHRVADAFAVGQVSLYTLYIPQEQFGLQKSAFAPTPVSGFPQEDVQFERAVPENATGVAGGTFMEAIGTFDQYFERVVTELSGSYLLGIEVEAADRNGKPHTVSVAVNRKGVDIRARKAYVIEAATRSADASASLRASIPQPPPPPVVPNPAREATATPSDLQPLIDKAAEYVRAYRDRFLALFSEERSEMKLSRWTIVGPAMGAWTVESQRRTGADYLLVKRPGIAGWAVVRDVFEVDGQAIRPRDGRLRQMFLDAPDTILERGAALNEESAKQDIGFVSRTSNVPTSPLLFVTGEHRKDFVFVKQGEQAYVGASVWRLAFAEHGTPAFARGASGAVPVSGSFWVDPSDGAIVNTIVRWEVDGNTAEVSIAYGRGGNGRAWVPIEMHETYTSGSSKLECVTKYSNFRSFEGG